MSIEWFLFPVDGNDSAPVEDEKFEPEYDIVDFDSILVGDYQGPMADWFTEQQQLSSDGGHSSHAFSADSVSRISERLAAISQEDFASPGDYSKASGRSIDDNSGLLMYANLAKKTIELKEFISNVASRGLAIHMEVYG